MEKGGCEQCSQPPFHILSFYYRILLRQSQDSLASLARRIRVCFSRQIPVRIRAHPRGEFNSVGACTPTELKNPSLLR